MSKLFTRPSEFVSARCTACAGGCTLRLSHAGLSLAPPAKRRTSVGSGKVEFGPPCKFQFNVLTSSVVVAPPAVMSRMETDMIFAVLKSQVTEMWYQWFIGRSSHAALGTSNIIAVGEAALKWPQ